MKCFKIKRPIDKALADELSKLGEDGVALAETLESPLPAVSLCGHSALSTAYGNDRNAYMVFAQQVHGFGNAGDTLLALTTSGNSQNCIYAAMVARAKGMKVIGITGAKGGRLAEIADICIKVPETETYLVQELTLPIYHYICARLEEIFFA
jgi:D-sedoheptulose 7-phosphate isomerase